jgi:hypothetical protein
VTRFLLAFVAETLNAAYPSRVSSVTRDRSLREAALSCAAFAIDLGRVLLVLPSVERGRRHTPAGPLLAAIRARGSAQRPRSIRSQTRLARAIRWVDKVGPGGPNCLRRTLLRVALDPRAACKPVFLGLNVKGPAGGVAFEAHGHAWLADAEALGRFDVEFRV